MGLGPPFSELKQGLRPPIMQCQNFPQKPLGGADIGGQILNFGPDFLKTGELWSTCFGIIGRHLRRTTSHLNYVGQSSKTKKVMKGQILRIIPIFSKLVKLNVSYLGNNFEF